MTRTELQDILMHIVPDSTNPAYLKATRNSDVWSGARPAVCTYHVSGTHHYSLWLCHRARVLRNLINVFKERNLASELCGAISLLICQGADGADSLAQRAIRMQVRLPTCDSKPLLLLLTPLVQLTLCSFSVSMIGCRLVCCAGVVVRRPAEVSGRCQRHRVFSASVVQRRWPAPSTRQLAGEDVCPGEATSPRCCVHCIVSHAKTRPSRLLHKGVPFLV
jgi:hypothetical protein